MQFFDTHTHLNDPKLYSNWEKYLQDFISIGGKGLVNIGVDEEWNQKAIEITKICKTKYKDIFVLSSIGYHPSEICFFKSNDDKQIKKWMYEAVDKLKKLYDENKEVIFGIGECGIDIHYPKGEKRLSLQKEFFDLQCQLANQLKLPIIIHSRDDFKSTLDIVKNYKDLKIYFHCWGYGPNEVKKVLDTFSNIWIGFAGNITYPKANNLRESLKIVPLEHLVLETDAPYLTPQKLRGKQNQPAYVRYIYEFVSEYRNIDMIVLANVMKENFYNLYLSR